MEEAILAGGRKDWGNAETALSAVLELAPKHSEANYQMGCMALEAGYLEDALKMAELASAGGPGVERYQRLYCLCREALLKQCAKSHRWVDVMTHARALALHKSHAAVGCAWLATACMRLGQMDACRAAYAKRLRASYKDPLANSQWLGLHAGDPDTDEAAYHAIAEAWDVNFGEVAEPVSTTRDAAGPLRIGIVSTTLRNHANANFLLPLLEALQAHPVRLFAYYDGRVADTVTDRFKAVCHKFISIAGQPTEQAAKRIRSDRIDLLLDINGHFDEARMALYTFRPAPVQLHYLGGTGALAMRSIDGRLADELTEPLEGTERRNDRIFRIAGGIHAFRPLTRTVTPGEPPALRNGYVTFGSGNALHKIEVPVLKLWGELLRDLPESRLRLVKDVFAVAQNREHFTQFAQSHGVPVERMDLMPTAEGRSYDDLSVYNGIDIALDTSPYNGITTTCEALWMGVPVVTLQGNRFVAREAAAILTHAGYPQWVAHSAGDYRSCAKALAADKTTLQNLRETLPKAFRQSPVCDAARLADACYRLFQSLCREATEVPG